MVTVFEVRERLLVPSATAEPYAPAPANRTGHTVRNARTWESRHRCRSAPPRTEAATWRLLARMLSPRANPRSGRALGRRSSAPGRSRGRDLRGRGDPWAAVVRATRCKPLATSELDEAVNAERGGRARIHAALSGCGVRLRRAGWISWLGRASGASPPASAVAGRDMTGPRRRNDREDCDATHSCSFQWFGQPARRRDRDARDQLPHPGWGPSDDRRGDGRPELLDQLPDPEVRADAGVRDRVGREGLRDRSRGAADASAATDRGRFGRDDRLAQPRLCR